MDTHILERLASLPTLADIPRNELEWLIENGQPEVWELGTAVSKGARIEHLWIILNGHLTIRVDRGTGPKMITEWETGEVVGILPYSRMKTSPGEIYIEEKTELLAVHKKIFSEMIIKCPAFTALTVHNMLDRARVFNTSDMQDEKMISLGKLSAGLAHELNNPASAAKRDAKLLLDGLSNLDSAAQALGAASLTKEQFSKIGQLCLSCLRQSENTEMSALQKSDLQDKITHWLTSRQLDAEMAVHLADTGISLEALDELAGILPGEVLLVVLKWLIARCTTTMLTMEIEQTTAQISRLIDAVKKFTFMDNLAEREFVSVETGIHDTLNVLVSKVKSKKADLLIQMDTGLPHVLANGSELNQVWFSLLDNALDAISESGRIHVKGCVEADFVVVRIIDNGPGIPSKVISRIFDPFYTTKPPGQGTGLGLDIARRLLRHYKGDISVHSRPGETEFRVTLSVGADSTTQTV